MDDDLNSPEEFTGFHSLDIANADTIVKVIKDILLRMNISVSNCHSQYYDGCSTIKGKKAGVAKQIKDIEKKVFFTHCYTNALNFVVGDAIKNSEFMKKAIEAPHEIMKMIKKTPKRDAKLDAIKNEAKIISNSEEYHMEVIRIWCIFRRAYPSS